MNTLALASRLTAGRPNLAGALAWLRRLPAELWARERRLALYGALMLALVVPMAVAWGLDERTLRGVGVWVKPIKFALSIGLLALTTAWFVGHLPREQRAGRAVRWIVFLLIGSGSFELGYITLQAALGQASHYNVGDAFHGLMYTLMGLGALVLTATQPMLAWQLHRHPDPARPAVYRQAVILGLALTFVFGAGVGILLGGRQPPEGAGLPLLGWSLAGGDLRPAHFVGVHAAQALPLLGLVAAAFGGARGRAWLRASTLAYAALFLALVAWGLSGRG
jgi:hypothetical protein